MGWGVKEDVAMGMEYNTDMQLLTVHSNLHVWSKGRFISRRDAVAERSGDLHQGVGVCRKCGTDAPNHLGG